MSDTFARSGGVFETKLYPQPVNFRADGVWQPIDDTLTSSSGGGWSPRADGYTLTLPKTLADPVRVGHGGTTLAMSLASAAPVAGSPKGPSVTYPDALPGLSVVDQATATGLKESLVLASASATTSVPFNLTLPAGATASVARGQLVVTGAGGAVLWRLPAPTVRDARGVVSASAVSYHLSGSGAARRLTVTVASDWLNAPGRAFPAVVDPTTTVLDAGDTQLEGGSLAGTNFNATSPNCAGYDATHSAYVRDVLQFDATDVLAPNAQVLNAFVGMYVTGVSGNVTIGSYQMSTPWTSSGATWNTSDGTHAWAAPGGDTTGGAIEAGSFTPSTPTGYQFWSATPAVKAWLAGDAPQDGVMFKATSESPSDGLVCFTTDSGPAGEGPFMGVFWQARTGDVAADTYQSYPIGDHEALKVNVGTGNAMVTGTDDDVPGVGMDLALTRTYNSSAGPENLQSALGENWLFAPGYNVSLQSWQDGSVSYFDQTGAAYTFAPTGDGTHYTSPPGINADLVAKASGGFTLTAHGGGSVLDFTSNGLLGAISDRNGNTITVNGNPSTDTVTGLTDTEGRTFSFSYRSSAPGAGMLDTVTDPAGRTVTYHYTDAASGPLLTSVTDRNGQSTQYGYNSDGVLNAIVSPAGRQITISYLYGDVHQVCRYDPHAGTTPCDTYGFTRSGTAWTTTLQDPLGHTTTYTVDSDEGKVTKVTDALGHSESLHYTLNDDADQFTDNTSDITQATYDGLNNLTKVKAPTGSSDSLAYPTASGSAPYPASDYWASSSMDGQNNCTYYVYDNAGNLTQTNSGQSSSSCGTTSGVQTNNWYQGDGGTSCAAKTGELCASTDGRGLYTYYSYDTHGNPTGKTGPGPHGAVSLTVDSLTNDVTTVTDGKGQTTKYFYDKLGHLTELRYDGGTAITCGSSDATAGKCIGYGYNPDGNLTSRIDNTGTTTWLYDGLGRQYQETLPGGVMSTVNYDQAGNVTSYTDAGGTVSYRYDSANNLWDLAEPGGSCPAYPTAPTIPNSTRCTGFSYDTNNLRTKTSYPSGETISYGYDNSHRATSITARRPSGTAFFTRTLNYLNTGADTTLLQSVTDNSVTTSYGYDAWNRLTSAVVGSAASYTYNYDADGNRYYSASTSVGAIYYGYDYDDELCWSGPFPGGYLSGCGGGPAGDTSYTYDSDRNQLTGGLSYTYNQKNQTTQITNASTPTTFSYADTGQGQRTSSTTGGATTNTVNGLLGLASQTVGAGTPIYFTRTPDGQLISLRQGAGSGSTNSYYLTDQQGSVLRLTNAAGTTDVAAYSYDPYGQTLTGTGTLATVNPYRYAGGYYDSTTGLYKLGERYYNPALGRFTQPDPDGSGFPYASDNPANYSDPDGLEELYDDGGETGFAPPDTFSSGNGNSEGGGGNGSSPRALPERPSPTRAETLQPRSLREIEHLVGGKSLEPGRLLGSKYLSRLQKLGFAIGEVLRLLARGHTG